MENTEKVLVGEVMSQVFHLTEMFGYEENDLYDVTLDKLEEFYFEEIDIRTFDLSFFIGDVETDETKNLMNELNEIAVKAENLLKENKIKMVDIYSGFGFGMRDYGWLFTDIADKKIYSPKIEKLFTHYKK